MENKDILCKNHALRWLDDKLYNEYIATMMVKVLWGVSRLKT